MHPYWATLIPRKTVLDTHKTVFDAGALDLIGTDEEKVSGSVVAALRDVNHPNLPRIEGISSMTEVATPQVLAMFPFAHAEEFLLLKLNKKLYEIYIR